MSCLSDPTVMGSSPSTPKQTQSDSQSFSGSFDPKFCQCVSQSKSATESPSASPVTNNRSFVDLKSTNTDTFDEMNERTRYVKDIQTMAIDLKMKEPNLVTLFQMSYEELYETFGARISGSCQEPDQKFNRFGARFESTLLYMNSRFVPENTDLIEFEVVNPYFPSFHVLFQVKIALIVALKGLQTLRWLTNDGYVVEIDSLKRVFVYDFNKPDRWCRFAILDYHLLAVAMNTVLMF
jgi:hypothetical protein